MRRHADGRTMVSRKGGVTVATVPSHDPRPALERRRLRTQLTVPEMWPSLAIGVIWLVVLADALFGPDIVSSNPGTYTRIPSAVLVAFFAWLATWVLAKHAFRRRAGDPE
jgi:hypothetical protein